MSIDHNDDDAELLQRGHASVLIPDPTQMTQQALDRLEKALHVYVNGRVEVVNTRLDGIDRATIIQLANAETAVARAEAANDKRFSSHNEFRAQLSEQAGTFSTRLETNAHWNAIDAQIRAAVEASDKQRDALLERINLNSLAIERASVAGNTIYLLRSEAIAQAKTTDDKIATVAQATAAQQRLASESLSDLRAQLADWSSRFMPRGESETRTGANTERLREIEIRMQAYPSRDETAVALSAADAKLANGVGAVTEKVNTLADRMAALDLRLTSRLDLSTGTGAGAADAVTQARARTSQMLAIIGAIAAFVSIAVTVLIATR